MSHCLQILLNSKLFLVAASLWCSFAWGQAEIVEDVLILDADDAAGSEVLSQDMSMEFHGAVESTLIAQPYFVPRGVTFWNGVNGDHFNRIMAPDEAENSTILASHYRFRSFFGLRLRAGFAYGLGLSRGNLYVGVRKRF